METVLENSPKMGENGFKWLTIGNALPVFDCGQPTANHKRMPAGRPLRPPGITFLVATTYGQKNLARLQPIGFP
jgi:hypothetical protein